MILHHEAEKVRKWMDDWHLEESIVVPILLLLLVAYAAVYDPATVTSTLAMIVALSPIWLPFLLGNILYVTWIHYVRYQFWFRRETALLEVQLPAEVLKSPAAMEIFLSSFWTTGSETTFLDRVLRGGFRSIWSLEIASNEGSIHFYIHGPKIWVPAIEARIYGQFPDAKVFQVDDYVSKVPFNLDQYDIWGMEMAKSKTGAIPIKTYVDFELDKNTDTPEIKMDPLTNLFEVMNNMGKDEYLWFQIILKAHRAPDWYGIYEKHDPYKDGADKEVKELMGRAAKRAKEVLKETDAEEGRISALLTDGEKEIVKRIERGRTKNVFDAGLRAVYIAKKDKFKGITGGFLFRIFQVLTDPYSGQHLGGTRGMIRFDYPWEDIGNWRENTIKRLLHFHFKHRAYFYVPYDQVPVHLNTEEVATLWHFPTSAVQTPGLNRVASKTSDAPTNLPTLPGQ